MTLERFLDYLKYLAVGIVVVATAPIWIPLWLLKEFLGVIYAIGCEVCGVFVDDMFTSTENWNPYYEYDPKTKKPKYLSK